MDSTYAFNIAKRNSDIQTKEIFFAAFGKTYEEEARHRISHGFRDILHRMRN